MPSLLEDLQNNPLAQATLVLSALPLLALLAWAIWQPKLFLLALKNLRRNSLRTALTCLATLVLVLMATLILTVVVTLDRFTTEKARDFKLVVTERWQLPSQMPLTHAHYLDPSSPSFMLDRSEIGPNDFMTWSFYGGTLDPGKMTRENIVFFFVMNPKHIIPMMDDMQDLDPALIAKLEKNRQGCLLGRERLEAINKRVGERIKVTSMNYKGIDLELEIVGELPRGRYNTTGIMNESYFNQELERYARTKGKHPLDSKRLNLVWLRVRDRATFEKVAQQIETASVFADRPVKCETASSGIATWLEPFQSLLWGMKWVLVPAILASMALVVANAIAISVRERRAEMAVMKVLGYRPRQILCLVLGESLLVGGGSGFLAAFLAWFTINAVGGLPFPMLWFQYFMIPTQALFWGLAMGFVTAFLGSALPAWTARSVKVSEVFAKVA
ncbi:MAG: ABC transporter permease [Planctomycetes bacterium]|nr:ABC transporter permease [Planctomycetota bacterium]